MLQSVLQRPRDKDWWVAYEDEASTGVRQMTKPFMHSFNFIKFLITFQYTVTFFKYFPQFSTTGFTGLACPCASNIKKMSKSPCPYSVFFWAQAPFFPMRWNAAACSRLEKVLLFVLAAVKCFWLKIPGFFRKALGSSLSLFFWQPIIRYSGTRHRQPW